MKLKRIQSMKVSSVIQPLCDTANRVARGPPYVQSDIRRSPLYTMYGGSNLPVADTHIWTVIFSRPDPASKA